MTKRVFFYFKYQNRVFSGKGQITPEFLDETLEVIGAEGMNLHELSALCHKAVTNCYKKHEMELPEKIVIEFINDNDD